MTEQTTVFILFRVNKDFGEDASKEIVGVFFDREEAIRVSSGLKYWTCIEEIAVGRLLD